jgi:hypothetical protein
MYTPLQEDEYIKDGFVYKKVNGVEVMIRKATSQENIATPLNQKVDEDSTPQEENVIDPTINTPLNNQSNTSALMDKKNQSLDNLETQKNLTNTAIDNSIAAMETENAKLNENVISPSSLTIPQAPKLDTAGTYIGADGTQKKLQYQTFDEWAAANGKTLPSDDDLNRSSSQYDVDEEAIKKKNEQTKRQRLGDQLVIAGAMFQELGNPQLYAGATQSAVDRVQGRADTRDEKVSAEIEKALAIKEAQFEGNLALMERLQTEFGMDMEYVDSQIRLLDFNNKTKKDDYQIQMQEFVAQLDVVKADHKLAMDMYNINIDKMSYIAEAHGDKFANEGTFDEALDGAISFMKDVQSVHKNDFEIANNISTELTAMFKDPQHPLFGATYEEKKAQALEMARGSYAATRFVEMLPETEAEYVQAELMNIKDHAQQWIGIGQEVFDMDLETSTWFAYEQIIGGNMAPDKSTVTNIDDGSILTKEDKKDLVAEFNKYGRVYEGLNEAIGMLNQNGDIASFKNTLATSQIGLGLIDIANAFGVKTEGLDKFVGDANEYNKLIQPLAVELIEYFTGEGSSRISEPERALAFDAMDLLKLGEANLFADPALSARFYGNLMEIADARQVNAATQLKTGKRDLTTAKEKIGEDNINTYQEETPDPSAVNNEMITMNNAKVFNSEGFQQSLSTGDKESYTQLIKISASNPDYNQNETNTNKLALEQRMRQDASKFGISGEELEEWIQSTLYGG